jgi:hypothetical protein
VSQILNPIGNLPVTLSNVYAGTIKHFISLALKKLRKSINLGPVNPVNVENSPILHPET